MPGRGSLFLVGWAFLALLSACGSSESPVADGDLAESESAAETDTAEVEEESDPAPTCASADDARVIPAEADTTFDLGPYLMYTTKTSVVIMWRTLTETDGTVWYGTEETPTRSVAQTGKSLVHEITLSGLALQTRYVYKVASDGVESALHHFHTAPADDEGARFVVMSDTHGVLPVFEPILEQVRTFGPAFLLHAGDAVHDGSLPDTYKPNFFEPIRAIGHEIPLILTIGNHESEASTWYDLVSYPPPAWDDGKHPEDYESTYGFRYGNIYVLVVNSNRIFFPITATLDSTLSKHIKALVASEEAQSATWLVAIAHESAYAEEWGSCFNPDGSVRYDGNEFVRKWLLPFLGEHRFHAFFSGDVHAYQRGKTEAGVFLFTLGGGGGSLDRWCRDWPEIAVTREAYHHLRVHAGCEELSFEAIDQAGLVMDFVTLNRNTYGQAKDAGPADPAPTSLRRR